MNGASASTGALRDAGSATFLCLSIGEFTSIQMLSVLPAFVAALISELGYGERAAGFVASVNLLAIALGNLVGLALLQRPDRRSIATLALLAMAAFETVSACITTPLAMLAVRAASGIAAGVALSMITSALARAQNAQRGFSISLVVNSLLSGACFLILPSLLDRAGMAGYFGLSAGLAILSAILLRFEDLMQRELHDVPRTPAILRQPVVIASILAMASFNTGMLIAWTYMARIGAAAGLDAHAVGVILGIGGLASMAGAATAGWLGHHVSRSLGIAAAVGLGIASLATIALVATPAGYTLGNFALYFAWSLGWPYMAALLAALDAHGRVVTTGYMVIIIFDGLAPGTAALIIDPGSYSAALTLGMALVLAGGIAYFLAARWLQGRVDAPVLPMHHE